MGLASALSAGTCGLDAFQCALLEEELTEDLLFLLALSFFELGMYAGSVMDELVDTAANVVGIYSCAMQVHDTCTTHL
jgi:hypothetical protein